MNVVHSPKRTLCLLALSLLVAACNKTEAEAEPTTHPAAAPKTESSTRPTTPTDAMLPAEAAAPADRAVAPNALASASAASGAGRDPAAWLQGMEAASAQLNGTNAATLLQSALEGLDIRPIPPEVFCYEALGYYAMTQLLAAATERDRCLARLKPPAAAVWSERLASAKNAADKTFDAMLTETLRKDCPNVIRPGGIRGGGRCDGCMPLVDFNRRLATTPRTFGATQAQEALKSRDFNVHANVPPARVRAAAP